MSLKRKTALAGAAFQTTGSKRNNRQINFQAIAAAALGAGSGLVQGWLPTGRIEGHEWIALNPRRADQSIGSFKVNLNTGKWADFASGDKGGDLISLFAYLNGLRQLEAARQLAMMMGMGGHHG